MVMTSKMKLLDLKNLSKPLLSHWNYRVLAKRRSKNLLTLHRPLLKNNLNLKLISSKWTLQLLLLPPPPLNSNKPILVLLYKRSQTFWEMTSLTNHLQNNLLLTLLTYGEHQHLNKLSNHSSNNRIIIMLVQDLHSINNSHKAILASKTKEDLEHNKHNNISKCLSGNSNSSSPLANSKILIKWIYHNHKQQEWT